MNTKQGLLLRAGFWGAAGLGAYFYFADPLNLGNQYEIDEWHNILEEPHLSKFEKERGLIADFRACNHFDVNGEEYEISYWRGRYIISRDIFNRAAIRESDNNSYGFCTSEVNTETFTIYVGQLDDAIDQFLSGTEQNEEISMTIRRLHNRLDTLKEKETSTQATDYEETIDVAREAHNLFFNHENEFSGSEEDAIIFQEIATDLYSDWRHIQHLETLEQMKNDGTIDEAIALYAQQAPYAAVEERCPVGVKPYGIIEQDYRQNVIFDSWYGNGCMGERDFD